MTIKLSKFQIAESRTFEKIKKKIDPQLYTKLKNIVYPQLRSNPLFGPNIKKLKGNFEGYYRFRFGSYGLFYLIDNEKILVVIIDFKHRQNGYR